MSIIFKTACIFGWRRSGGGEIATKVIHPSSPPILAIYLQLLQFPSQSLSILKSTIQGQLSFGNRFGCMSKSILHLQAKYTAGHALNLY
jgi:hypothetical protein